MKNKLLTTKTGKLKAVNQALIAASLLTLASAAQAQNLTVTVTNLTHGLHFTPLITAAHTSDTHVFSVTTNASTELQMMAEGGNISGLSTLLMAANANLNENPAGGLLAPAMSTTYTLTNDAANTHLSLAAMVLPSNDGFVGIDSWKIPETAGTYTMYLNAYDAGTEANNELVVSGSGAPGVMGIPAAPGGDAGTGGSGVTTTESNTTVHIHRGSLGDDNLTGGKSDLDNSVHRWLNPVAKLTVVVE